VAAFDELVQAAAQPSSAPGRPQGAARPRSAPQRPGTARARPRCRQPAWDARSAAPAELLARWDGLELREAPLGEEGGGQGQGHGGEGLGGSQGGARPQLRVSCPTPLFPSPHDPLYAAIRGDAEAAAEAARRSVTFARADPAALKKGGAARGGVGGGRAGPQRELPFKAAPSGVKRGF
jgi:hypothetical protein